MALLEESLTENDRNKFQHLPAPQKIHLVAVLGEQLPNLDHAEFIQINFTEKTN